MSGAVPPPPLIPAPPPRPEENRGLAVASFTMGLVSLFFSVVLIGGVLAFVGIAFGLTHLSRQSAARGMAIAGIVLSSFGLLASIVVGVGAVIAYQFYQELMGEMREEHAAYAMNWTGVQAPDLDVQTIDGQSIRTADLRGKRVIVDIWATWCPPCREEIPHFNDLAANYPDDLIIIAISDEDAKTILDFRADTPMNYPVVSSESFSLPAPYDDVPGYPTTYFIDRNGVIQDIHVGYGDYETLAALAMQDDFAGAIRTEPAPEIGEPFAMAPNPLTVETVHEISGRSRYANLHAGRWDDEGALELAALDADGAFTVFDIEGETVARFTTNSGLNTVEIGRGADGRPRALAYTTWSSDLQVYDVNGKEDWRHRMWAGVNGAHWGDVDGDGVDEMAVGGNGGGGLLLLSSDGKQRWRKGLGNVWMQAVVPRPDGGHVVATEAGGSVHIFDKDGKRIGRLSPQRRYLATIYADYSPALGKTIVVGIDDDEGAVCFDEGGKILWNAPAREYEGQWGTCSAASGDLDGDGEPEWILRDSDGSLVVVNMAGMGIARIPMEREPTAFAVIERPGAPGLLAVASGSTIRYHRLVSEAAP